MNGFQHIANLGNWQRRKQPDPVEPAKEVPVEKEPYAEDPPEETDQYKDPFPEDYEQAISLQAFLSLNNSYHEWNLRDFYRDVKTNFEPDTNSRPVFEKCIRLAR